jgi:2,4-dienoyl-CoA reductase-like NADH-dependent reductase (Old Yellow Enzyme family)
MTEVSAKAGQFVVISYDNDLPNRMVVDPHNRYEYRREVTMPTEQAVDLYNQLRSALYD